MKLKKLIDHPFIVLILVWLLVVCFYIPAIPSGFLSIDDDSLINLPFLKSNFDLNFLLTILKVGNHIDYYPIRDLTYWFDWQWSSDLSANASPIRLQNFFWLLVSAFGLFYLQLNLGINRLQSLFVSCLWVGLGTHAEILIWASGRKDLLAMVFILLYWASFFSKSKIIKSISCVFFGLSLLSKATFVFMPVGFLLFILYRNTAFDKTQKITTYLTVLMSAIMVFIQTHVYSQVNDMYLNYLPGYRLQALLSSWGKLTVGIFFPSFNSIEVENWSNWSEFHKNFQWAGVLLLLFIAFTFVVSIKKRNYLAILFFLILGSVLVATPGFNPMHRNFYSVRYLEPVLLILILIISLNLKIFERIILKPQSAEVIGCFCLLICILFLNFNQAENWESPLKIAKAADRIGRHHLGVQRFLAYEYGNEMRWGRLDTEEINNFKQLVLALVEKCQHEIDNNNLAFSNGTFCWKFFSNEHIYFSKISGAKTVLSQSEIEQLKEKGFQSMYHLNPKPIEYIKLRDRIKNADFLDLKREDIKKILDLNLDSTTALRLDHIYYLCLLDQKSEARRLLKYYEESHLVVMESKVDYLTSLEGQKKNFAKVCFRERSLN